MGPLQNALDATMRADSTADEILDSVASFCNPTSYSHHC
jgi:hypothetical protein